MEIQHLRLPDKLRDKLSKPMGELIRGEPEEVTPKVLEKLKGYTGYIVTVGDVVSQMLVSSPLQPHLMITDGMTKRTEIDMKLDDENYEVIISSSPAGEISEEAWSTLRYIVESLTKESKIHLIIDGEEDLLVLPLIIEMGDKEYTVLYGQPNEGAVVIAGTLSKRFLIEDIMDRMETVSDEHRDN